MSESPRSDRALVLLASSIAGESGEVVATGDGAVVGAADWIRLTSFAASLYAATTNKRVSQSPDRKYGLRR